MELFVFVEPVADLLQPPLLGLGVLQSTGSGVLLESSLPKVVAPDCVDWVLGATNVLGVDSFLVWKQLLHFWLHNGHDQHLSSFCIAS